MKFEMLKFSSAKTKISEISQSLLNTTKAGVIPLYLGSTAQTILVSQMINHDFTCSDAA
jgi:hypothetical protein